MKHHWKMNMGVKIALAAILALFVSTIHLSLVRGITLIADDGEKWTITSLEKKQVSFISANMLTRAMQGTSQWFADKNKLVMKIDDHEIIVVASNPFIVAGDRTFYSEPKPELQDGDLFVPRERWTAILNQVLSKHLVWDEEKSTLSVQRTGAKITHIQRKQEKGQTIAEIHTSGPTHFEWKLLGRTLIVDVKDAFIANEKLSSVETVGHIQSVEVFQLVRSAQVTFLLNENAALADVHGDRQSFRLVVSTKDTDALKAETEKAGSNEYGKLDKIKTIVIDPGHGGEDPGAVGPGNEIEKDIVLQIALQLRDLLKNEKDLKVILTRETDVFVKLRERTRIANDTGAHLFLSIHCNSIAGKRKRSRTRGYKAYINKSATNNEDKLVAMMENAAVRFEVDEDQGSRLSDTEGILLDMLSNEFLRESEDWASMIVDEMGKKVKETRKQHTGVGQAGFFVLNGAYMPAVLMEVAYVSHPKESKLLKSKKFQKKIANALYGSILRFKKKYTKKDE